MKVAIIPAAGKGLRFKELGKHYPKCCLPYKEKPIIIHQIENLLKLRFDKIRVIVNHQKHIIQDIIRLYGYQVEFIEQKSLNGLSGAIYDGIYGLDENDDVFILLSDILPQDWHFDFSKSFISVKTVPDFQRWCMVNLETHEFFDKPSIKPETEFAVSGIYYLENCYKLRHLLEIQFENNIKINNEFQISTILKDYHLKYVFNKVIDFGTLDEYFENKNSSKCRAFNTIIIKKPFVLKQSGNIEKLKAEHLWYKKVLDHIAIKTPRVFNYGVLGNVAYYKMEYIKYPSLRESYIFSSLDETDFENIFKNLLNFLDNNLLQTKQSYGFNTIEIYKKCKNRIKKLNLTESQKQFVNKFMKTFYKVIQQTPDLTSYVHGDFCFSNILYDVNSNDFKLIDPRGDLLGSHYYEIAKLCHSVLFDYDFIDLGLYYIFENDFYVYDFGKSKIKNKFIELLDFKYNQAEQRLILFITASLFLSMIPLHYDNKSNQKIYFRIFEKIASNLFKFKDTLRDYIV